MEDENLALSLPLPFPGPTHAYYSALHPPSIVISEFWLEQYSMFKLIQLCEHYTQLDQLEYYDYFFLFVFAKLFVFLGVNRCLCFCFVLLAGFVRVMEVSLSKWSHSCLLLIVSIHLLRSELLAPLWGGCPAWPASWHKH